MNSVKDNSNGINIPIISRIIIITSIVLSNLPSVAPFRVTRADHLSPSHSVSSIRFCHTNPLHILLHHIHGALPLIPLTGSFIFNILPLALLCSCPNHLNFAPLTFPPNCSIRAGPLRYLFLFLSTLVTPNENLNIFSSTNFSSGYCLFVSATLQTIAGLTTILQIFPFPLAAILPQITP